MRDFLLDRVGASLCPIAPDAKQDVDLLRLQEVGDDRRVLGTARASQYRSTQVMNVLNETLVHHRGLQPRVGIESGIPVADAQHATDTIVVSEFQISRSNDVVQSRREAAAGHKRGSGLRWVKEDLLTGSRFLEGKIVRLGPLLADVPPHTHPNRVIGKHDAPLGCQRRRDRAGSQRGDD